MRKSHQPEKLTVIRTTPFSSKKSLRFKKEKGKNVYK